MGKQIYLTDSEIEWLKNQLGTMSEMGAYSENWDGYRDFVDRIYDKLEPPEK